MIRSTIEFGNGTDCATHSPSSGSRSRAKAPNIFAATWPLPWMLSQDMIVNGAIPRSRRRTRASVISPNVVAGGASPRRSAWIAGLSASNSPVTGCTL